MKETKTIPYSLWWHSHQEYEANGWSVRGYELVGPLSLPTSVDLEREIPPKEST